MITIQALFDSLPLRFKSAKAKDFEGIFHFKFSGDVQTHYTVEIKQTTCRVSPQIEGLATCEINADAQTYLEAELGKISPADAFMTGKIQTNNPSALMQFATFFQTFRQFETQQNAANNPLKGQDSRRPSSGPLQGLRILDFSRLLPGPLGTMMLADMGAEVVKVESPNFHDYTRDFPPFQGGESAGYLAFNRSKRSLSLDYSQPEGRELILKMLPEFDILVEQFRPGVMAKMGLDYDTLKQINPKLIYVSITGYGQTGPYAQLAGHDLNYITYAGLLSGNQNEAPQVPLVQIADIAGGSYMTVIACLSALQARHRTGKGQFVDVAMLDGVMPLAANAAALHWATGKNLPREQSFLSGGLLNYGIYPCKGGRYIVLGTLEAKFWHRFCEVVEKPDWKERMLEQNSEKLTQYKEELKALLAQKTAEEWSEIGTKYDLLINTVYELEEVYKDPQVQARNMVVEFEHPKAGKVKSIGVPLKFSETEAKASWYPPLLGEDSKAIMQEMGVSEEAIRELIAKGVLKCDGV